MKKTIRSIISVLLILSVIFTCLALPAGAAEPNKTEEPNTYGSYYEKIYNEGYTPLSTEKAFATVTGMDASLISGVTNEIQSPGKLLIV